MAGKSTYEELEQRITELEREVLKRQLADQTLQESEQWFRNMFDACPFALVLYDADGNTVWINQAEIDLFGINEPEEILSLNLFKNADFPDEFVRHLMVGNIVRFVTPFSFDDVRKQKIYNTSRSGYLYLDVSIAPIHLPGNGKPSGYICHTADISERVQAEKALRESEEKYRLLVKNLPSVVYKGFKDFSVEFFDNKVEVLTGYSKDEFNLKKTKWSEIIIKEDLKSARECLVRALKSDRSYIREYRIKTKAQDIMWIQERGQIVCDDKDRIEYVSGVFFNITDRKLAKQALIDKEKQLQHAQRMEAIGTLAGGVAHDFNNLMMGMLGNLSLILYDIEPEHRYYDKLQNIEKLIKNGSKLTSQLLGYARQGKYEVKPVDLNQIVIESCETFGRTKKEIAIHMELAEDLLAVNADESQIQQVLLNLYINAADAMPNGGDLFLTTRNVTHMELQDKKFEPKPNNYALLKVTDNGSGMDAEIVRRIFDPFFTTKEVGQGTGLGLASAYGIIKGHGGYIDVESEKGHGTTFRIYLPASNMRVPKPLETSDCVCRGSETILLVDDEEMVLEVSVQLFEMLGYTVLAAQNGKEAIEIYQKNQHKIDLVILDMIMPVMSGGETYDKLKEINPDVHVLLSSGYSMNGQAREILARGCIGFIQKPFSMQNLSLKIREILDQK
jgi:PAS domain S-box-containing protein